MGTPIPRYSFAVPWFMLDLYNRQLITSKIIPGDIRDTKQIILTEVPIPGLNFQPVMPGGNANRKISFILPLIKRSALTGNVLLLKQFEQLRNQATGFRKISTAQFTPNPKVLYYWGTGSLPLVYWVARCDATHHQGWVNSQGMPQYSEIEIELILDETDPLYKVEELFRKASALVATVLNPTEIAVGALTGRKPY